MKFDATVLARETRRPALMLVHFRGVESVGGCDGQPRWSLGIAPENCFIDQFLPGDRVLSRVMPNRAAVGPGEGPRSSRIREYDLAGRVVWECEWGPRQDEPFAMAPRFSVRLPDGTTIAGGPTRTTIIDASANVNVRPIARDPRAKIRSPVAYRDGRVISYLEQHTTLFGWVEDDAATGRESFRREGSEVLVYGIGQALPNGGRLATSQAGCTEFDRQGHVVWQYTGSNRVAARLREGSTWLQDQQRERLVTQDRDGRMVDELFPPWGANAGRIVPVFQIVQLGFDDSLARRTELAQMGTRRLRALNTKDPIAQLGACRLIRDELKGKAATSVPRLLEILSETCLDPARRRSPWLELCSAAFDALAAIGPEAATAVAHATEAREPAIRAAAAAALGTLYAHQMMPFDRIWLLLKHGLQDPDLVVRRQSVFAMRHVVNDRPDLVIPVLIEAFQQPDPNAPHEESIAWCASGALSSLHENNPKLDRKATVKTLIAAAALPDDTGRSACLLLISRIASIDPEQFPVVLKFLLETLNDRSREATRAMAASCLGTLKASARPAIPSLIAILTTEPKSGRPLRFAAISALEAMGDAAAESVPILIDLLQNSRDEDERVNAVRAIGALGLHSPKSLPALEAAANDSSRRVRAAVSSTRTEIQLRLSK